MLARLVSLCLHPFLMRTKLTNWGGHIEIKCWLHQRICHKCTPYNVHTKAFTCTWAQLARNLYLMATFKVLLGCQRTTTLADPSPYMGEAKLMVQWNGRGGCVPSPSENFLQLKQVWCTIVSFFSFRYKFYEVQTVCLGSPFGWGHGSCCQFHWIHQQSDISSKHKQLHNNQLRVLKIACVTNPLLHHLFALISRDDSKHSSRNTGIIYMKFPLPFIILWPTFFSWPCCLIMAGMVVSANYCFVLCDSFWNDPRKGKPYRRNH